MSEKLIIRNFGSITNVELDLRKVNVLIGESGTGKSTVAKVLAFCKYFTNIQGGDYTKGVEENLRIGLDYIEENLVKWGLIEYVRDNTFVSYECENYKFVFQNTLRNGLSSIGVIQKQFVITSFLEPKSTDFTLLLDKYTSLNRSNTLSFAFFEKVGELIKFPFYIYGERVLQSIFSMGKDFTSNLSDPLFKFFVDTHKIQTNFKSETEITPLNIQYKNVEGRGEIRKIGLDKFISLNNSASGYMSVIPIVLIIKYYNEIRKKKKSFIIEEPELNIFPSTQNEVIKFISENLKNIDNLLMTTHSPYILTSLNNLMYAHQVGKLHADEVEKIIERKYWLNPNDVSAYELKTDGTCEDIFNREENLISAGKIDEISNTLNEQFDELLNIELVPR